MPESRRCSAAIRSSRSELLPSPERDDNPSSNIRETCGGGRWMQDFDIQRMEGERLDIPPHRRKIQAPLPRWERRRTSCAHPLGMIQVPCTLTISFPTT